MQENAQQVPLWFDFVSRVGIPAALCAYFCYRDYKLADRQTAASEAIAANLAVLNDNLGKEE